MIPKFRAWHKKEKRMIHIKKHIHENLELLNPTSNKEKEKVRK